jgi:hypothetical protein
MANAMVAKYGITQAELIPKPIAPSPGLGFRPEDFTTNVDPFAGFKGSMDAVEAMRQAHQARKDKDVGYVKNAKENFRPLKIFSFLKDVLLDND